MGIKCGIIFVPVHSLYLELFLQRYEDGVDAKKLRGQILRRAFGRAHGVNCFNVPEIVSCYGRAVALSSNWKGNDAKTCLFC